MVPHRGWRKTKTKKDLAGMISEEAQKQKKEPKETLGSNKVEADTITTEAEPEPEVKKVAVLRRTAWLQEDHLVRLEALKRREKARLRDDPDKRVAVTSLIDEAIEKYLTEME